ncbi:MAG: hypothetical protein QOF66_219 [Mycobacterium sp.]|jgi:hypothetical protein|nr:hypothetical protein [Mycobacterium sp.]MDT5051853.1 hypothetical protein [Mycobacterium sp.]
MGPGQGGLASVGWPSKLGQVNTPAMHGPLSIPMVLNNS